MSIDLARIARIARAIEAGEQARCACGCHGSWDGADAVSGTSGSRDCYWAGCSYCDGSAVGRPILRTDWRYGQRHRAALAAALSRDVAAVPR